MWRILVPGYRHICGCIKPIQCVSAVHFFIRSLTTHSIEFYRDSSWPIHWEAELGLEWELFLHQRSERSIRTGLWTHTQSSHLPKCPILLSSLTMIPLSSPVGGEHRWDLLHRQRGFVRHLLQNVETDNTHLWWSQPSRVAYHVR